MVKINNNIRNISIPRHFVVQYYLRLLVKKGHCFHEQCPFFIYLDPQIVPLSQKVHMHFLFFLSWQPRKVASLQQKKFFLFTLFPGVSYPQATSPVIFNFFCVIINFWDFELNECQLERWESRAFLPHYLCYFVSYKS